MREKTFQPQGTHECTCTGILPQVCVLQWQLRLRFIWTNKHAEFLRRGNDWSLALINKIISTQVPSHIGTAPNSGTVSVLGLLPIKGLGLYIDFRCATIDVCRTVVRKRHETRNAVGSTASPCAYRPDWWNARDNYLLTGQDSKETDRGHTDR